MNNIDHYQIIEKLGSGGMGEVYKAFDTKLERNVAVKVMHQHLLDVKKHDDRFLTEARAAAKIMHPNVVTIYEIGEGDFGRYIVMEYVEGRSLNDIIHSEEKLLLENVVKIIQQMLLGVSAAHKFNIFHRDIKPDNVIVTSDNIAKILDFGIAKIQSSKSMTMAGDILGTIEYMAPEQMLGEKVDYRCDIYAIGVVFYHFITNRLPFTGDLPVEILFKKLNEDPVPPSFLNDQIPKQIDQILLKALKKEKEDRWLSADKFAAEMEVCLKNWNSPKDKTNTEEIQIDSDENLLDDSLKFDDLSSVFIGRNKEYKKLLEKFHRVSNGSGQTIILQGEAGVGKSSLIEKFKKYVEHEDGFVLYGECLYQEGLDPYLPYIDALRRFIEKDSHKLSFDGREKFKENIREKVPLLTEFTERFSTIFSTTNKEKTQEFSLTTGNLAEGIFYIVSHLSTIEPTVLVIDDIHWADEASLRLFHYLSKNINNHKILLVGISRTDKYDLQQDGKPSLIVDMFSRLRQENEVRTIDLFRLKRDECDLLIDGYLSKTMFSEEFYESIFKETKGNPFFVIETLKTTQKFEYIYQKDGVWKDKEGFKIEVPDRVEDVFIRRLNGLSEKDREILQIAAILGYKFDVSLLATLTEKSRIKLIKILHKIERELEIITNTESGFQFEHPMLRDLLYDEIPLVLAREYHLMAANELQNMYKDDLGTFTGDVAKHYRRGGDHKKATPLLFQAASKAFKISAYREASLFFEGLLDSIKQNNDSIPDSISQIDLYLKLGISYEELGRWELSLDAYSNLLKISKKFKNPNRQIDAHRRMGRVYDKLGRWDDSLSEYQRCLEIVDEYPIKNVVSRIYNNIGLIYFQKGNYEEAIKYFEKTLKSIDSEFGELDCAHALTNIGTVFNIQGKHKLALDRYQKALSLYKKTNNKKNIARVYHNIGMTHTDLQDWAEAIKAFDKCFSLADNIEDKQLLGLTYLNMGKAYAKQGHLKKAMNQVNKAMKLFRRMTDVLSVAEAHHVYGIIYSEKRNFKKAMMCFKESLKINEEKKYYDGIADNYLAYGNLNRDFGNIDQARECYEHALEVYKKLDLNDKVKELVVSIEQLNINTKSDIFESAVDLEHEKEIENYDSCT